MAGRRYLRVGRNNAGVRHRFGHRRRRPLERIPIMSSRTAIFLRADDIRVPASVVIGQKAAAYISTSLCCLPVPSFLNQRVPARYDGTFVPPYRPLTRRKGKGMLLQDRAADDTYDQHAGLQLSSLVSVAQRKTSFSFYFCDHGCHDDCTRQVARHG